MDRRLLTQERQLQLLKMWKAIGILVLCSTLASASCPKDCQCPSGLPTCATGVSLVLDSCGCCKVCARQLFEDCSRTQPCDHTKGLQCNFGGGFESAKGICRDGRTCEYNNKIYQNGEIFHPNCKYQCTCMDGAIGCVSLCPHEVSLPKVGCAKPRRLKVSGHCCEQLICPEEAKPESPLMKKFGKKVRASEEDLASKNELAPLWKGELESLAAFRSHPISHMVSKGAKCVPQTTVWSPCSKSCGTGVSSRVTNSNVQCKLMKETRLCEVHPCNQKAFTRLKKGRKCNNIEKARHPVKLSYGGCRSLKKFRPTYCGSCSNAGRCCRPHRTQTIPVRFRCKNGETFSRMVMMIESCKCNIKCSAKTPALHRLFKGLH
ncbi:protein CYR61-like isoform X2 [Echeneis naucrates]|uniref:protein CYR61-like isoform X2 n=1 Tax=Echeneis naucrates TaxID=173247 RepID=UPI001113CB0C|nr:protein CYR61-like isoform X2 [Echeneis naucrates]